MVIQAEVVNATESQTRNSYTIQVTAPKFTPQMAREARARAKALVANGIFNDVESVLVNVSKGKLRRVTSVSAHRKVADASYGRIVWSIDVSTLNWEIEEVFNR